MDEREQMRLWVEAWKQAGPELEAIRRREIQEADNRKVIEGHYAAYRVRLGRPIYPGIARTISRSHR